jgi:hypothetical protein
MQSPSKINDECVADVGCSDDSLIVDLMDERSISVSLAGHLRLDSATAGQRSYWKSPTAAMASFGLNLTRICSGERLRRRWIEFGVMRKVLLQCRKSKKCADLGLGDD